MPASNEQQPLTAPVLTHARMDCNNQYPDGFIHLNKKAPNGDDLKSIGYVRGTDSTSLAIGWTVNIQKDDRKKTWEGTITSGPDDNGQGQWYWTFEVVNKENKADPIQDDTLTVTVTNTVPQTSNSVPADPQPAVIP
jgi:hypothetical protein